MVFNYGMKEVESFLIPAPCSGWTAIMWTVCASMPVASMLYLDYNRKDGEWEQNVNGGRNGIEASKGVAGRRTRRLCFCL